MTISDSIKLIQNELEEISPNISLEISLILSHTLRVSRTDLLAISHSIKLSSEQHKNLLLTINRRKSNEPLELITGTTEFYSLEIQVEPGVLIPRPETEGLVDIVLNHILTIPEDSKISILEVGPGTGAITVSVCKQIDKITKKVNYLAVDISKEAISCTISNLKLNYLDTIQRRNKNLDIHVQLLDIMEKSVSLDGDYPIIISNPPYLTLQEMDKLESSVRDFEPHSALYGGDDGLDFYRRILEISLGQKTRPIIFLEISPATKVSLIELFSPLYSVTVGKDLFGRIRYLSAIPLK